MTPPPVANLLAPGQPQPDLRHVRDVWTLPDARTLSPAERQTALRQFARDVRLADIRAADERALAALARRFASTKE